MISYPPAFDELWVVSDLHMGGRRDADQNLQAFNQGPRLAKLIAHAAEQSPAGNVALVLNGDVFDSLAEDGNADGIMLDAAAASRMMTGFLVVVRRAGGLPRWTTRARASTRDVNPTPRLSVPHRSSARRPWGS